VHLPNQEFFFMSPPTFLDIGAEMILIAVTTLLPISTRFELDGDLSPMVVVVFLEVMIFD